MTTPSKKDMAAEFLTMCASGEVREAYKRYVRENFKHHNPYCPCDRRSLMEAMEKSSAEDPNKSFQIRKVIESADTVAVFSRLQRSKVDLGYAVVHILKFDGEKIAEMWDVSQEIPKESPNELGMF